MNTEGSDGPSKGENDEPVDTGRARQLFGTKAGAKPWDAPRAEADRTTPIPKSALPTASAPYPDAPQYAPRTPVAEPATAPVDGTLDDDGELTLLHPNYKLMMRIGAIFAALVLFGVAAVIEGVLRQEIGLPLGVILVPAALLALFIAIPLPTRRFLTRGYQISGDRLRVVRGVMFHSDTVVPFGRVQHIDVNQGPIERALGIATLTLHTAGNHNASVSLPGLGHDLAVEMREAIRAHIKRESM